MNYCSYGSGNAGPEHVTGRKYLEKACQKKRSQMQLILHI